MSAGFFAPQAFVLPVSGSHRLFFSDASALLASFQLYRESGQQDATFRVLTSNFSQQDVAGFGVYSTPLTASTTSTNYGYWFAEPGASGTAFTGSATDAASPFVMHFADIGSRHLCIEVSSSFGGNFILAPHVKRI